MRIPNFCGDCADNKRCDKDKSKCCYFKDKEGLELWKKPVKTFVTMQEGSYWDYVEGRWMSLHDKRKYFRRYQGVGKCQMSI